MSIVLGHPEYYPSLILASIECASSDIIPSLWEGVPDEAFIRILDLAAMAGAQGVARYRDEFDESI